MTCRVPLQRIQRYGSYGRVRQVVLRSLAPFLSQQLGDLEQLVAPFEAADVDRDGRISHEEFAQIVEDRFSLSPSERQQLLLMLDIDQEGQVTYSQWLAAMADWKAIAVGTHPPCLAFCRCPARPLSACRTRPTSGSGSGQRSRSSTPTTLERLAARAWSACCAGSTAASHRTRSKPHSERRIGMGTESSPLRSSAISSPRATSPASSSSPPGARPGATRPQTLPPGPCPRPQASAVPLSRARSAPATECESGPIYRTPRASLHIG